MKTTLPLFACALALFSGCIQPQNSGKYFEITLQDPACGNNACFHEIFALDDGFVMVKKKTAETGYVVSFCSAGEEKKNELFSFLETSLEENKLEECAGCRTLHLFYNNGTATKYRSIPEKDASFEAIFFENAKSLCHAGKNAEFFHVIFGKGDKYSDYHIFSNNKVVFERFGLKEGELLSSDVSTISESDFAEMKSFFAGDFFSSAATDSCQGSGYFYGYIEAYINGKYNYAFSCGGNTAAGKAFLAFAKRFSE